MTLPHRTTTERNIEAPETRLVAEKEFVQTFKDEDATPSVMNLKKFKAGSLAASLLTYFDDGQDGQEISILGDGLTTVVHNASKILTNTGANKLLATGKVYRFTRYDSKWVEDA